MLIHKPDDALLKRGHRSFTRPSSLTRIAKQLTLKSVILAVMFGAAHAETQCAPADVRYDETTRASLNAMMQVFDDWIGYQQRKRNIPGLAFGLTIGNRLYWANGYGVTKLERGEPVTPETVFRIASVTKTLTATSILKLRDEGKLALDDPITKYLPEFSLRGYEPDTAPILIRHLLTHTAGLPRDSALSDYNRWYHPPAKKALAVLPEQSLVHKPGEQYRYTNLAFGLLGLVIEAASGKSYDGYVEQNIFSPLGMSHSMAHPKPEDKNVATGYFREFKGKRQAADYMALNIMTPAGGAASNVSDMAKYVSAQMGCPPEGAPPLLSKETLDEMQSVQFKVGNAGGVGFSWDVNTSGDVKQISHSGGLPTQTSHIQFLPTEGIGVVAMTNAEDGAPEELAAQLLGLARSAIDGGCGDPQLSADEMRPYLGRYRWSGWLGEEYWVVPVGGRIGIVPMRSDNPSAEMFCLSHDAEDVFTITRGFAYLEKMTFKSVNGTMRAIGPAYHFDRIGPLPNGGD